MEAEEVRANAPPLSTKMILLTGALSYGDRNLRVTPDLVVGRNPNLKFKVDCLLAFCPKSPRMLLGVPSPPIIVSLVNNHPLSPTHTKHKPILLTTNTPSPHNRSPVHNNLDYTFLNHSQTSLCCPFHSLHLCNLQPKDLALLRHLAQERLPVTIRIPTLLRIPPRRKPSATR